MILLVDDDKDIRLSLAALLEHAGYRVETASNGVEAYRLVKDPDCKGMVLDVNMPRINGIELLLLMQAEDISVPTILMTGFGDFEESELKQFANVKAFLRKPFEVQTLVELIGRHVARK